MRSVRDPAADAAEGDRFRAEMDRMPTVLRPMAATLVQAGTSARLRTRLLDRFGAQDPALGEALRVPSESDASLSEPAATLPPVLVLDAATGLEQHLQPSLRPQSLCLLRSLAATVRRLGQATVCVAFLTFSGRAWRPSCRCPSTRSHTVPPS